MSPITSQLSRSASAHLAMESAPAPKPLAWLWLSPVTPGAARRNAVVLASTLAGALGAGYTVDPASLRWLVQPAGAQLGGDFSPYRYTVHVQGPGGKHGLMNVTASARLASAEVSGTVQRRIRLARELTVAARAA